MPVMVPPVPALARNTSTFPDEGRNDVDGVVTTSSMISGPVVYSWARGLFAYKELETKNRYNHPPAITHVSVLVQDDTVGNRIS